MLGMGLTMQLQDFSRVFSAQPWLLLFGLGLQYTIMPCLGFAISRSGIALHKCVRMCTYMFTFALSPDAGSTTVSHEGLCSPKVPHKKGASVCVCVPVCVYTSEWGRRWGCCVPISGTMHARCRYAGLDTAAAIGITLLSSCPGGTASNIVAFIAKVRMLPGARCACCPAEVRVLPGGGAHAAWGRCACCLAGAGSWEV